MRTRSPCCEWAPFHRHVVDKGAVETVEIEDHKLLVFFFDLGMTAGNGSVGNAERGCRFAADDDRQIFNREDAAFKSSGNGSESRVHRNRVSCGVLSAQVYAYRRPAAIANCLRAQEVQCPMSNVRWVRLNPGPAPCLSLAPWSFDLGFEVRTESDRVTSDLTPNLRSFGQPNFAYAGLWTLDFGRSYGRSASCRSARSGSFCGARPSR